MSTPNDLYNQLTAEAAKAALDPNAFDKLVSATNDKLSKLEEASAKKQAALDAFDRSVRARQSTAGQITGLGIDSDLSREFIENTLSGTGSAAKGVGDFASIIGLGNGETGNQINDYLQGLAGQVDEQQSIAFRNQMLRSTPTGDLFDPSSWDVQDVSTDGILGLLASMGGQFTPQLAAMVLTRGASLATQTAATAATGAAQAGGGAASEQEQYIDNLDESGLYKASGLYRDLRKEGKTHEEAKATTRQAASRSALLAAGAVGGLGGAATNYILRPFANKLQGEGLTKRASELVGLSAVEEGVQEVAEGVAAKAASNVAIGGEQDVTEDSLTNAVLGAGFGASLGGAKLALDETEKAAQRAAEVQVRAEREDNLVNEVISERAQETPKEQTPQTNEASEQNSKRRVVTPKQDPNITLDDTQKIGELFDLNPVKAAETVASLIKDEDSRIQAVTELGLMAGLLDRRIEENPESSQELRDSRDKIKELRLEAAVRDLNQPEKDTQEIKQEIIQDAVKGDPDAVEDAITLTMESPDSFDRESLQALLDSENANLNQDQKRFFNRVQAYEAYLNDTDKNQVSDMIRNGSHGFKGMEDYRTAYAHATASGNPEQAAKELEGLQKFRNFVDSKLQAIERAMAASRATGRKRDNSFPVALNNSTGEWEVLEPGTETAEFSGSLNIHLGSGLNKDLANDLAAIDATLAWMDAVDEYKDGSADASALNQTPSENRSTSESEKSQEVQQSRVGNDSKQEIKKPTSDSSTPKSVESQADDTKNNNVETEVSLEEPTQKVITQTGKNNNSSVTQNTNRKEEQEKGLQGNPFIAYFTRTKGHISEKADKILEDPTVLIPEEGMNEDSWRAINHFAGKYQEWLPTLEKVMGKDKGERFNYQDSSNFLRNENGEHEASTYMAVAFAAYSFIRDEGKNQINSNDVIAKIMGFRDADGLTLPQEAEVLRYAGHTAQLQGRKIGEYAVKALGYRMKSAPEDVQERAIAALGNQAIALLLELGLAETHKHNTAVLAYQTREANDMLKTSYHQGHAVVETRPKGTEVDFLRFKVIEKLQSTGEEVIDIGSANYQLIGSVAEAQKGSGDALGQLFQAPSTIKMPTFEEPKDVSKYTTRGGQEVTEEMQGIINKAQKEPWELRQSEVNIFNALSDEAKEKLAGVEDETDLHVGRAASVKAKNDGLKREIELFKNFLADMDNREEGRSSKFFLPREIWKNFRVGYGSAINPQTSSKVHRHLMKMSAWESTIQLDDSDYSLSSFKLGVAEGLGIDTEKRSDQAALKDFEEVIQKEKYQRALTAIGEIGLSGEPATPEQEAAIAALGSFHAVEALSAYFDYTVALNSGSHVKTFKTSLMREVDGVNNGPILLQMQLAAAKSPRELQKLMEKGGMYGMESIHSNVANWRSEGSQDLYESLAHQINKLLAATLLNGGDSVAARQTEAYYKLTGGEVRDETGKVVDRQIKRATAKTPIMAFGFGSSVQKAVQGMAAEAPKGFYENLESAYRFIQNNRNTDRDAAKARWRETQELIYAMNQFLPHNPIRVPSSVEGLMTLELDKRQLKEFSRNFMENVGAQTSQAMETEYDVLIEGRNKLNKAVGIAFDAFNSLYTRAAERYVDRLIAEGEIQIIKRKNKPDLYSRDLTEKERKEVLESIKSAWPVAHTAMSKRAGNLNAGLRLFSEKKVSVEQDGRYETKTVHTIKDKNRTIRALSKKTLLDPPSVYGLVGSIHSFDSSLASTVYGQFEALNVHDALGLGINNIYDGAEALNKTTFEQLRDYSVPEELVAMMERTLEETTKLEAEMFPESVSSITGIFTELHDRERKAIYGRYKRGEISEAQMKKEQTELGQANQYEGKYRQGLRDYAFARTKAKLLVLANTRAMNQYGLEGGEYITNDADRQAALDQIANFDASGQVTQEVEPEAQPIAEQANEHWGEVGTPMTRPDSTIESFLREKGKVTIREFLPVLQRGILNGNPRGYAMLLRDVAKRINKNTEIVYVTPEMGTIDFGRSVKTAKGWAHFNVTDKKTTIYVKSSDFKHSAVTPEVFLHEMLHVALRQVTRKPGVEGKRYKDELVSLLKHLRKEAKKNPTVWKKFKPALENVDELIAWGLTNKGFQEALTGVKFQSNNGRTTAKALHAFFKAIRGLLFGKNDTHGNAFTAVVINTAGLMEAKDAYIEKKKREQDRLVVKAIPRKSPTKRKRDPKALRPEVDSLLVAIAKLGGIDRVEAEDQGIDPAFWAGRSNDNRPVAGMPIFRKEDGKSFDSMAEALSEFGYFRGVSYNPNTLLELIDKEIRGDEQFSDRWQPTEEDYLAEMEERYGRQLIQPSFVENDIDWANFNDAEQQTLLQEYVEEPLSFTTEQIFTGLVNRDGLSGTQASRLRGILDNVVKKIHGPFGAYALMHDRTQTLSAEDTYLASMSGFDPFVSDVVGKLNVTNAEAYVMQQVEMTVRTAFDNSHASYKEMERVFREAKRQLKPEDFIDPETYNFIFDSRGKPETYLSRFVAMSMVYSPLTEKLDTVDLPSKLKSVADQSVEGWIAQQGLNIFNKLSSVMPKMMNGTQATQHLSHLVRHLVDLDGKHKALLSRQRSETIKKTEDFAEKGTATLRKAVEKVALSKPVQNSPTNVLSGLGQVVAAVAGQRGDVLVDHLIKAKNKSLKGLNGPIAGLVNEIRGATDGTQVFYKLLSMSNAYQLERKRLIEGYADVVLSGFKDNGKDLKREQLEAITRTFIRTDAQGLIDNIEMSGLTRVLNDDKALDAEIKAWSDKLTGPNRHYYRNQAHNLGYHLATGNVAEDNLMLNAHNIAYMANTQNYVDQTDPAIEQAKKVIDVLVSLHAMRELPRGFKETAREVLNTENNRTDGENGVEAALSIHRSLQKQAYETLFDSNPINFMKGYTKEIYDPHIDVQLVSEPDWKEWIAKGYTPGEVLAQDPADPDYGIPKRLFHAHAGRETYATGIMSTTGKRSRGSSVHSGTVTSTGGSISTVNTGTNKRIERMKLRNERELFKPRENYKPSRKPFLVPTLNHKGKAENYRYLMNEDTKSRLLNKNNQVTSVLGGIAGSNYDKLATPENNNRAIKALREHYNTNFAKNADSFVEVSLNSSDKRIRETYALLPDETKREIRKVWGGNKMYVDKDVFDMVFGYRKASISHVLDIEKEHRTVMENIIASLPELLFGKKAALRIAQAEDIWQEIVTEVKDILVIKNLFTLLGNISSNVSLLLMSGVSPKDIYNSHAVAMKGYINYQRDAKELMKIEAILASGYLGNQSQDELESRVAELKGALENNPVKEMVDRGMMQTIVEDVEVSDDGFSYQSRASQYLDSKTTFLPDVVKSVGKELYLSHDTPLYQLLSQTTAMSDFVARYTLLQHLTKREKNPMSKDDAYRRIEEAFIQYDVPSHVLMQYANDMGLLFFMKYFLRIQKVLLQVFAENPANVIGVTAVGEFFSSIPTVAESSFLGRLFNNPFSAGAFEAIDAVPEIITIQGLTAPL